MTLPYENASAGDRALAEIQKILREFGCSRFGSMQDDERQEILVQFSWNGRDVTLRASVRGYAKAWLKEHPYTTRHKHTAIEHERKALQVASVAVYSVLRDWVKGQMTAISTGLLSFEGAFLGQIMLPSGQTVLEHVETQRLIAGPQQP